MRIASTHQADSTLLAPFGETICVEADAPSSAAEKALCHTSKILWQSGMPLWERHNPMTGFSECLIILTLVVFLTTSRSVGRMIANASADLVRMRRNRNVFDDNTINRSRTLVELLWIFVLGLSLTVYGYLTRGWVAEQSGLLSNEAEFSLLMALIAGFITFKYVAYTVVGRVFSDREGASLFVRSYSISLMLVSLPLLVAGIASFCYPTASKAMFVAAVILLILSKTTFIYRGFMIFYRNFWSLLYFILYLCTLEIIPAIFACTVTK